MQSVLDERIYGRPKLVMRGVYFFSFKAPCLLKIASKAEKCVLQSKFCAKVRINLFRFVDRKPFNFPSGAFPGGFMTLVLTIVI